MNKAVEKPATAEAPSFIRSRFVFSQNTFGNCITVKKIIIYKRLYDIRKGVVGDWKTHFTAEESGEWDRFLFLFSTMGRFFIFSFRQWDRFFFIVLSMGWLVRIDRHGKIHLPGQVVR